MIKTMNCKMTTNHNYQQLHLKNKTKNKLSKQLEEEQNHRNGDHMEGYQWGGEEGKCRKKVRRIRSIIGRYKIDQEYRKLRRQRSYMYNPWT